MKKIVLIRGIPGSGKTSLIKNFFDEYVASVCVDDYFMKDGQYCFNKNELNNAHTYCLNKTESLMASNWKLIAVHNTFTTEWEMEPYFKLAKEHGYEISTIIVENRHGGKSVHDVPFDTLLKMKQRFHVKLLHED